MIARRPPPWLSALLVTLVAWVGFAALFGRWSGTDWSQPHWLEGDPVEVYARVQVASEQPGSLLRGPGRIGRLGAPGEADWSAYPIPDRLVFLAAGQLTRLTDLITATQVMAVLLLGLNATAFFLVARWLRWRWEWAAAAALVFAFCNHHVRWGVTLSLAQTFVFPPLILLCARAVRRGPVPGRRWQILGAGLGLWLGQANPYLAYFGGVLAVGGLMLALKRGIPRARVVPLLAFLAALPVAFLAVHARSLLAPRAEASAAPLARQAADFSTYALHPVDWFVPPADHRVAALGHLGDRHLSARHGQGEFFYNYLGMAGATALLALVAGFLRAVVRRRGRWPDAGLALIWILAFACVGGINFWLSRLGLDQFRAVGRIGFLALAWALLHAGTRLDRLTQRLPRLASVALAGALALAANWEQTPPLSDRAGPRENRARWESHRDVAADLARSLPAPSVPVFQLPVVPFPEAGRTGTMPDYEHLLPFLTHPELHLSYGHLRLTGALRWAEFVARQPVHEMVALLERAGFGALWLDERAVPDGYRTLADALRGMGRAERPRPPGGPPVRLFLLQPAASPLVPDYQAVQLFPPWDPARPAPAPLGLHALAGWYLAETNGDKRWRWAAREGRLGLAAPGVTGPVRLRFSATSLTPGELVATIGDVVVWRDAVAPGQWTDGNLTVEAPVNSVHLRWEFRGRLQRPAGDGRRLGFALADVEVVQP